MKKVKSTLFVDEIIYKKFRELCKKHGWIVSKQFENYMENVLREHGELKGD